MTPEQIAKLRRFEGLFNLSTDTAVRAANELIEALPELLDTAERFARIAAILRPLEALEAAATKAPWSYERHATIYRLNEKGRPEQIVIETCSPDGGDTEPYFQGKDQDTDILLAARNALPALLREIQETP